MVSHFMGLKNVAFASITNPASGMEPGWVHDGEANLIAARKCLEGLTKTFYKMVESFDF
jgi:hypothetical protein